MEHDFEEQEDTLENLDANVNHPKFTPYMTFLIMGLCILNFALQIFSLGFDAVFLSDKIVFADWARVGADIGSLTYGNDEYWRLITCQFVHFGAIHLLMNMVCLYQLGSEIERSFGRLTFIVSYIGGGIVGGMVSAIFHCSDISAGASGGVFTLLGMLLMHLVYNYLSKQKYVNASEIKELVWFFIINIGYGLMVSNVNFAAHIGGAVAGLAMGLVASIACAEERNAPQFSSHASKAGGLVAIFVILAVSICCLIPYRGKYDLFWRLTPLLEEYDDTIHNFTTFKNARKDFKKRRAVLKKIQTVCADFMNKPGVPQLHETSSIYEKEIRNYLKTHPDDSEISLTEIDSIADKSEDFIKAVQNVVSENR